MRDYIADGRYSEEISIGEIIDIVKSHAVFLVSVSLAFGLGSYLYAMLQQPVYSASSKVLVLLTSTSPELSQVDISPEPLDLDTYKQVALSKDILSEVAGRELSSAELQRLRARFSVRYSEGRRSGVLSLTVESNDPELAAREANAWARALIEWERSRSLGTLLDEKKAIAAQLKAVNNQLATIDPRAEADRYASLSLLKTSLQQKLDQLDVLEAGIKTRLHLLEPAQPPQHPVRPRPLLNAVLAASLGLVLALFAVFLLETLSVRVRDTEEAAAVTGLPVLAEFPRVPGKNGRMLPRETALFLKTSLTPQLMGEETSVIAVTSTVEGEGKTSVALALALAYAHEGRPTLLVDGDLRKPEVKDRLSLPLEVPGLRNAMENLDDATTNITDNLDVLPCVNPPADANDFISRYFKDWLRHTVSTGRYRYIVIDTAPILPVPDTLIMAPHASTLLLVAAEQKTSKKALRTAIDVLAHLGVKPYGLVMNFVKNPSTIFLGGYENYHYGSRTSIQRKRSANGI